MIPLILLFSYAECVSNQGAMKQVTKDGQPGPDKYAEGVSQDKGRRQDRVLTESRELFNKGIDFAAGGTDPSWSLEIDFDKVIRFSAQDGFVLNTPPVTGTKDMDANVTFYHARTEEGELRITISAEKVSQVLNQAGWHELKHGILQRIPTGRAVVAADIYLITGFAIYG